MASRPHTTLVFCNGEPPARAVARRCARRADFIVAADGGANTARALGITPQVIIGDLDSVSPSTRRAFRASTVLQVRRQDNTDLEKTLDYLVGRRAERVILLGATGRRLDMTLANLGVCWKYVRTLDLIIAGTGWHAIPVWRDTLFAGPRGTTVSLLPFGRCRGVTLSGLRYPLRNARFAAGDVAVSNVSVRDRFRVRIENGHLLVVVLDDFLEWQISQ